MKTIWSKTKELIKKIGRKFREKIKTDFPVFSRVLFCIAIFSLVIHIVCICSPGFTDFFNFRIAGVVRLILAKITSLIPFSLAEMLMFLILPILIFIIVFVVIQARKDNYTLITRFFCGAFSIISLFYSIFVFTLGTGYHASPLADKLSLERRELSSDELIEVSKWLASEVNVCVKDVQFMHDSSSVMPYDFAEMNDRLCEAYEKATRDYDFIMGYSSRIKPILNSKLMSRAGLLGMYSYYTGESNVNVDYMDYNLVYTCAHEMSHQRGISKEDEANFMAFLVCLESDDPYIRYSGYLNMFEYMLNPMYKALESEDRTSSYFSVLRTLDERARRDIGISQEKTTQNEGVISKITNKVNNTFIQVQGDERGTASYGLVVELAAAYYYKNVKTDA